MPEKMKENLANVGQESFELQKKKQKDKIVLNIQEEPTREIVLHKEDLVRKGPRNFTGVFGRINKFFISHSTVKVEDMANFFHLLSVMISAGIPMVKSLRSLAQQSEKSPKLQMVIEEIAVKIEEGDSFSEAMIDYPDVFSEQAVGMVQSGEASGQLANVLENLAEFASKLYEIKAKVKSALMYPTIVFFLLIAIMTAMMIFVIPKLSALFSSVGKDLPLITRIVVGISDFMVNQKLLLAGIILGIVVFLMIFRKTDFGRYAIDVLKIRMPGFGHLFQESYLSRFASSLSNLLNSRITIVKTLEITANSIGNEVYRKKLLLAMEDIKQGIPLAESLIGSSLFSPMLVNMIEVGESTAQLDTMMAKVAEFYQKEVDNTVEGLSKILEPVIIVIIALAVGGVVAAVMLPIMQLSDLSGAL